MSQDVTPPFLSSLAHHAADPFRLLVESVVEYAIYMVDPAGRIASWNPGAERIYGYSAEEIIGRHFTIVCVPEDVEAGIPEAMRLRVLAEGACNYERMRKRKDGSRFVAVVTISILNDYFGNHAGFSVVTRDVTERKRAEEALRRERDLSHAILGSLPGIYYMYDEQRQFIRWNARFEEVSGYDRAEIARIHPLDFFPEDDRPRVAERIARVFETGHCEVEADFRSKSGRRTPYYFNGVLAEIDGNKCLLGMGIDLTAQREAQNKLREADLRLRLATNAANIGLWDWDLRSDTVFYSDVWKQQIGYADGEIGTSPEEWSSRVHPDDLEAALARIEAFRKCHSTRYESEFRLRHRDGSYRSILSQASLLCDESGTPIRMLGSHIDVTDVRRLERQLHQSQKMEAIGLLAGGVAHDFNNLLTVINGYSELLAEGMPLNSTQRTGLDAIREAGEKAAILTRQLLAFGRMQVLAPRVLDLNVVIADAEKLLRRLVGEDVILATALSPNIGRVKADPSQVEQVLMNLVVNARDAMPKGGRLTIETQRVTLDEGYCRNFPDLIPGEYVLIAVSDTGEGMDAATQARVFEPFFTTKGPGKGTGLGLATVHGIVKQSRGHVAVYSEPGRGTTFKVYLPEVIDPADPQVSTGNRLMPAGRETILLVEDEHAVRTFAKQILQSCGYRVLDATDGQDAVRVAEAYSDRIDVLVSDVVLPHLGGRELAQRVTQNRADCRVLFLSGYTDDAIIRHGVLGAEFAFLQKPFTPSALAQKVRDVLDNATSSVERFNPARSASPA